MRVRDQTGARQRARDAGLTLYFTGIPCRKAAHICERRVDTSACVECNKENKKRWARKYPGRNAEWNRRNPDVMREIGRRNYRNNLEIRKTNARNQRAKRREAEGQHTKDDIDRIWQQQKGRCAYCRKPVTQRASRVDHIVALKCGGSNWPSNLQLTCQTCNSHKSAKHPIDFAQSLGLLL